MAGKQCRRFVIGEWVVGRGPRSAGSSTLPTRAPARQGGATGRAAPFRGGSPTKRVGRCMRPRPRGPRRAARGGQKWPPLLAGGSLGSQVEGPEGRQGEHDGRRVAVRRLV